MGTVWKDTHVIIRTETPTEWHEAQVPRIHDGPLQHSRTHAPPGNTVTHVCRDWATAMCTRPEQRDCQDMVQCKVVLQRVFMCEVSAVHHILVATLYRPCARLRQDINVLVIGPDQHRFHGWCPEARHVEAHAPDHR